MSEEFLCPRRGKGVPAFARDTKDTWNDRDGYPHCSYCGSLKPESLFQAIEVGAELGPTDKNYKVYVHLPDPRAGEMKITGASNGPTSPGANWTAATEADIAEFYEGRKVPAESSIKWVMRTERQTVHDKFYFQHFSEEDKEKFINLLNAKTMKIGYPGHFYNPPFFVAFK